MKGVKKKHQASGKPSDTAMIAWSNNDAKIALSIELSLCWLVLFGSHRIFTLLAALTTAEYC